MNRALLLLVSCSMLTVSTSLLALSDAEVERELQAISREMSKKLPLGNSSSMLISVTAGPGRRITYSNISSIPAREWSSEMKANSRRIAVNNYCSDPGMAAFREFGVTGVWTHSDKDGRHITTNTVAPSACK